MVTAGYIADMSSGLPLSSRSLAKVALTVLVLAAATGAAFAAWMENGAGIFRSMIEAGLAWCM